MSEKTVFTWEEVSQGLKNIGVDINCGACAGLFFTGTALTTHTCGKRSGEVGSLDTNDPTDKMAYLIHYMDLSEDILLDASFSVSNVLRALEKSAQEKDIRAIKDCIHESLCILRYVQKTLGIPNVADDPVGEES
jgi:hypothetical protein